MMRKIVFVWDNFGPMHNDRCLAVAQNYGPAVQVVGIEMWSQSSTYDWISPIASGFQKITIGSERSKKSLASRIVWLCRLLAALVQQGNADYFLCHYERPEVFSAAILLRLLFRRVYVMNDSKFDDYERSLWREVIKSFFYLPYQGALASGLRSRDYLRFLGIKRDRIGTHYNSLSVARIRRDAGIDFAANGGAFRDRYFIVVARLVPKKNLHTILRAYSIYVRSVEQPRPLKVIGSGPLEQSLKASAAELQLGDLVEFCGFLQTSEVARALSGALALLLLSVEEQFGNVVIEAQALGLPCIVSTQCGARDSLIRSGVNGFIVEEDNPEGAAFYMQLLSQDETLWQQLCRRAAEYSKIGDVSAFVGAIDHILAN